jgi:molecular chaperone GrpE
MPEPKENSYSPTPSPEDGESARENSAAGNFSQLNLEQLFQEAEQTVDQIVQTKKKLKQENEVLIEENPAVDEEMTTKYSEAITELEEFQEKYRRLEFEFQNYKNRMEKQLESHAARAKAELLQNLVEILDIFLFARKTFNSDSFNHNIDSYQKGFNLLYKQMDDLLAEMGMERIESEGQPFDPNFHQAAAMEESDEYTEQIIIKEIKAGYIYMGMLLRPSLVKVGIPRRTD